MGTGQPRICQRRKRKEREPLWKEGSCQEEKEEVSRARADQVQEEPVGLAPKDPVF